MRILVDKELSKKDRANICIHESIHALGTLKRSERGLDGEITMQELLTEETNAWILTSILGNIFGADNPDLQAKIGDITETYNAGGYDLTEAVTGINEKIDPSSPNTTVKRQVKGTLR